MRILLEMHPDLSIISMVVVHPATPNTMEQLVGVQISSGVKKPSGRENKNGKDNTFYKILPDKFSDNSSIISHKISMLICKQSLSTK